MLGIIRWKISNNYWRKFWEIIEGNLDEIWRYSEETLNKNLYKFKRNYKETKIKSYRFSKKKKTGRRLEGSFVQTLGLLWGISSVIICEKYWESLSYLLKNA